MIERKFYQNKFPFYCDFFYSCCSLNQKRSARNYNFSIEMELSKIFRYFRATLHIILKRYRLFLTLLFIPHVWLHSYYIYQHLMLHRFKTIIELDKIPSAEVNIISRRIDYITIELKHKSKMDTKYAWIDSIVAKLSHRIELRGPPNGERERAIGRMNKNTHESRHNRTQRHKSISISI